MLGKSRVRVVGRSRVVVLVAISALAFGLPVASAETPPPTEFVAVSVAGGTAHVSFSGGSDAAGQQAAFAPDRVIVRFRSGTSFLPGSRRSLPLVARANVHLVTNPPGLSVTDALARYRANPNVVYAEPDYMVTADQTSNDYSAGTQWDLAKISAPAAWDVTTGSVNVVVAIVDTGIAFAHPDLAANIWSDATTPSIHGYTCMSGSCIAGGADDHGHGTHVAGTIGAATNNGVGIAGLNWNVRLLAIKFLDAGGSGQISDAVLGFQKLLALKQAGVNIRVTNNSWGGGGYSQALRDAMAALAAPVGSVGGTVNVCAAGNSGVNADFMPMYPAAYEDRSIVSVLATDVNDTGAYFTNYGTASVDIAAPGVSIWSTESTGTCSLCDPTGYRYLSGTSMASPHVAGVAAAMLSLHPTLTAEQARDALLRPDSYDAMTDAKAAWTSSGGRLNFAKVLGNAAFYANPTLNAFPTVTVGPDVQAVPGDLVAFSQSSSDPDGDALRATVGRGPVTTGSAWMLGNIIGQIFPATAPFTAPAVSRMVAVPYDTSVSDRRGGGATGRNWAVISPSANAGSAPSGVLTVPGSAAVGSTATIGFVASDPDGGIVAWDIFISGMGGSSGSCCYTGSSVGVTFNSAGVYRVSVTAMDRQLNSSPTYTGLITVGGAAGSPPIADASLSTLGGPAPLTVTVDMSGSADTDGTIANYFNGCGGGFASGSNTPISTCTFTTPGIYWLLLHVTDNAGNMGDVSRYVVVTPTGAAPPPPPPTTGDTTPPTLAFTSPSSGAILLGSTPLAVSATDGIGGSGVREVQFYLDSTAGSASLGTVSSAPYGMTWDAAGATTGSHTLYAIARDNAGNASVPVALGVSVTRPLMPSASLSLGATYPFVNGAYQVPKKTKVTFNASTNAATYGIARVDFLVGTTVVCSDTIAPYSCTWQAPGAAKTVQALARAYDGAGNMGSSATLTLQVK